MEGWGKVKEIAKYCGMSERTVREWLKAGLKYSKLPSGSLLIKYSWVDAFLETFEVTEDKAKLVDSIVDETLRDFDL